MKNVKQKIMARLNLRVAVLWVALFALLLVYYRDQAAAMPAAYFVAALATLVVGICAKLFVESRVEARFGEHSYVPRLVRLGLDAVLLFSLIALYLEMRP